MVLDLLTDPDRFFQHEVANGGFAWPIVIVSILGIVNVLAGLPVAQVTTQALSEQLGALAGIGYVSVIVVGFLSAFVTWLLFTVVFYLVARFGFDGEGSFTDTLRIAAWGLAPAIVSSAINGVLTFYALQSVTTPSDPSQIPAFVVRLQNDPLVLAAGVLGVFILLWQAFIWTFAVKHAQRIPLRNAAITVALPVAVAILLRVYNLV